MCLIAFAWQTHPDYALIVGANRDEWHDRPAAAATWWDDHPDVLAGRDLKAGGTWLGVSRGGRFAALTNFRDPSDRKTGAPSRGQLVSDFLVGGLSGRDYLSALRATASRYQDFNLLVGDGTALYCFSSRLDEILTVPPGIHALSNHSLDEPWPKVEAAKAALQATLQAAADWPARRSMIGEFLSDARPAPEASLPDTGVGLEWEHILSPALITTERYGTRCSTVIGFGRGNHVSFDEYTRDRAGLIVQHANYLYSIA